MWTLPPLDKKFVTITIQPHHLSFSWIDSPIKKKAPLLLRTYQRFTLQNLELEKAQLFGQTYIKKKIKTFLATHQLDNAFIICSIAGPDITEQFVPMHTASPTPNDFPLYKKKDLLWGYRYIYPRDHQSVFYLYSIPRTILLQYQLLAIAAQLNLIALIPQRMTLLYLYKFLYGSAFRQTQLAIDMIRHHNMIEHLFTPDLLARIIDITPCNKIAITKEIPYLLNACGLFVSAGVVA